jgi:hypothetical protein
VLNHENVTFTISIRDIYGNPVTLFDYNVTFAGIYNTSGSINGTYSFSWETQANFTPDSYWFNVTIFGYTIVHTIHNETVHVRGYASIEIISPSAGAEVEQGDDVNVTIHLQDLIETNITQGQVSAVLVGSSYTLSMTSDGIYSGNISTTGLTVGNYTITINVVHGYLQANQSSVFFLLKGQAFVTVTNIPSTILNHENVTFTFELRDIYGNPITIADVDVTFADTYTNQTSLNGNYIYSWETPAEVCPGLWGLNLTISGTYVITSDIDKSVTVMGASDSTILSPTFDSRVTQSENVNFTVLVQDQIETNITFASITVLLHGTTYALNPTARDGMYTLNISTAEFPLGNYSAKVTITHGHLQSQELWVNFGVEGYASIDITFDPSPATNSENVTFSITVRDQYGNPLDEYNYSMYFHNIDSTSGEATTYTLEWEVDPDLIPGSYDIKVNVSGTYLLHSSENESVPIRGIPHGTILAPSIGEVFEQGDSVVFTVLVQDENSNNITGALVTVNLYGSPYTLTMVSTGLYNGSAPTIGLPLGHYSAPITITHSSLDIKHLEANFTLKGFANFEVLSNPKTVVNFENVTFTVRATDLYVNPLTGFNFSYSLDFGGFYYTSGYSNSYQFSWTILPNITPGQYYFNVSIESEYINNSTDYEVLTLTSIANINIITPTIDDEFHQGVDSIPFVVNLTDLLDNPMTGATIKLLIHQSSYGLDYLSGGIYNASIPTSGWAPGQYEYTLDVDHSLLDYNETIGGNVTVTGGVQIEFETPDYLMNYASSTINFSIYDEYQYTMNNYSFTYNIVFKNQSGTFFTTSGSSDSFKFSWTLLPNVSPGTYAINVTITGNFIIPSSDKENVEIHSKAVVSIISPTLTDYFNHTSDTIPFEIHVTDSLGGLMFGASVTINIRTSTIALSEVGVGVYSASVSLSGWAPGEYNYTIDIEHSLLEYDDVEIGILNVVGLAEFDIDIPNPFFNHKNQSINVTVLDSFGNPLSNYDYTLDLAGQFNDTGSSSTRFFRCWILPDIEPGEYSLNITVFGDYVLESSEIVPISLIGKQVVEILSPDDQELVQQGNDVEFRIHLQDQIGTDITGATADVTILGSSYAFSELGNGIYSCKVDTGKIPLGNYSPTITIDHYHLDTSDVSVNFKVYGDAEITLSKEGDLIVGEYMNFTIVVNDMFSHPITEYEWEIKLLDQSRNGTVVGQNSFDLTNLFISGPPDRYRFLVNITNPYVINGSFYEFVDIWGQAYIILVQPDLGELFYQNATTESILFNVSVIDTLDNPISDAQVKVTIHDTVYLLEDDGNGCYSKSISYAGWQYKNYSYHVTVSQSLMYGYDMGGYLIIIAHPTISIRAPTIINQGDNLTVSVDIADKYDYPITGLDVRVNFLGISHNATETSAGTYEATFENVSAYHNSYNFSVDVCGELCTQAIEEKTIIMTVPEPKIEMSAQDFTYSAGFVLLISIIGMMIYFKAASSIQSRYKTEESIKHSIRRLDLIYGAILFLGAMVFVHSLIMANANQFGWALIETIILVGVSVLLYGLWLYRDAFSAILKTDSLSRKRVALGVWHLILVPLMIYQILTLGAQIELFQVYILEVDPFQLGGVNIPYIVLTIFGTYLSSIVVVVINHYKETKRGIEKITHMKLSGTPENIVEEERSLLMEKSGNSIRTKFLMFLILVGATTVSTLDFIRSQELAVIILLPLVFLVAIPWFSSKIVKGLPKIAERIRSRKEEKGLEEVADEDITIDDLSVEELREYTKMDIEDDDEET